MTSKSCPSCDLIHPESALRCECGYDFESGRLEGPRAPSKPGPWFENPYVAIAALCLCGVIGVFLVARTPRLSPWEKALCISLWAVMASLAVYRSASH